MNKKMEKAVNMRRLVNIFISILLCFGLAFGQTLVCFADVSDDTAESDIIQETVTGPTEDVITDSVQGPVIKSVSESVGEGAAEAGSANGDESSNDEESSDDDESSNNDESSNDEGSQTTVDYTAIWDINYSGMLDNYGSDGLIINSDGMAEPIINYSYNKVTDTQNDDEKYRNTFTEDFTDDGVNNPKTYFKDVLRFCVYVETDYDTDMDGKNDLVQALVQVPTAAVFGDYDAPTIFHASPYMPGCSKTKSKTLFGDKNFDPGTLTEADLLKPGTKREPGETSWSSQRAAEQTNVDEWHYMWDRLPGETEDKELDDNYYLSDLITHDYFLVRGFAVVISGGIGTYGSEGLETCGSVAERDAFKNIIEWIHGDRVAYTDKTNNIPIYADWSNKKVGMEGMSYDGTMAYEVATTGVAGLETVVPEAGISSWYDYSNTQGMGDYYREENNIRDLGKYDYTTSLASENASRFFGKEPSADGELKDKYKKYLGYLRMQQIDLRGLYGDHWAARDYTYLNGNSNMKASALIVQGLNDYNVNCKQADLMRLAFKNSNCDLRVILHQGAHDVPDNMEIGYNSENCYYYDQILNMWFTNYLWQKNGVLNVLPNYWVQNNTDGYFFAMNNWGNDEETVDNAMTLKYSDTEETVILTRMGQSSQQTNAEGLEELSCITISENIVKDTTISGSCEVSLNISVADVNKDILVAGVMLYDEYDPGFDAYDLNAKDEIERVTISSRSINRGGNLDPVDKTAYKKKRVEKKFISKGMINLKTPGAGYDPKSAVAPSEPIANKTYYNYVIHLIPTVYTVKAGHSLRLYICSDMDYIISDANLYVKTSSVKAKIPLYPSQKGGGDSSSESSSSEIPSSGNSSSGSSPSVNSSSVSLSSGQDCLFDPDLILGIYPFVGSSSGGSSSGTSSGSSSSGSSSGGGSSNNSGRVNYDELTTMLSDAITKINAQKTLGGSTGVAQQIVTWDKGESLPYNVMKILQDNPNITLVFKCKYAGQNIIFAIPGSAVKANPLIKWYGPLYLLTYYGQYAMIAPPAGSPNQAVLNTTGAKGTGGLYVVRRGDTLSKIAKRLNTTVKNLVKINKIKNKNHIFPGQVISYWKER